VGTIVVVALLLVAQPAGEGEGEGEAPDRCDPVCVDDATLAFCADGEPTTLPCASVAAGARCGLLSAAWGADCLLPAGAACDPDYGFGDSRCDDGLSCRDQVCAPGEPAPSPPATPTAGTTVDLGPTTTASPFACAGCAASPADGVWAALGALLLLLRRGCRPSPRGTAPSPPATARAAGRAS
jgi:hypothetical protein